jgi:hypothetical protein
MILNAYKENWETIVEQLEILRQEMSEGRTETVEGIAPNEAPFFELLLLHVTESDELSLAKTKALSNTLLILIKQTANIKNFWTDKASERKRIEGLIEDELQYARIAGISEKSAELTTEIMKLAKNRAALLS